MATGWPGHTLNLGFNWARILAQSRTQIWVQSRTPKSKLNESFKGLGEIWNQNETQKGNRIWTQNKDHNWTPEGPPIGPNFEIEELEPVGKLTKETIFSLLA